MHSKGAAGTVRHDIELLPSAWSADRATDAQDAPLGAGVAKLCGHVALGLGRPDSSLAPHRLEREPFPGAMRTRARPQRLARGGVLLRDPLSIGVGRKPAPCGKCSRG